MEVLERWSLLQQPEACGKADEVDDRVNAELVLDFCPVRLDGTGANPKKVAHLCAAQAFYGEIEHLPLARA